MEPWLDSLSEDWNSQPRSSSPSLPNGTPAGSRRNPPNTSLFRSKIPRGNSRSASTSRSTNGLSRPSTSHSSLRANPLSERSINNTNTSPYAQSRKRDGGPVTAQNASQKTQISSFDSVVKLRDPNKTDVADQAAITSQDTPEWKRLALRSKNAYGGHADLFAAPNCAGLEAIFTEPPSDPGSPNPHQSMFTFAQDENMPSSPPPWPGLGEPSARASAQLGVGAPRPRLGVLKEEEELKSFAHGANRSSLSDNGMGSLLAKSKPTEEEEISFASKITGLSARSEPDKHEIPRSRPQPAENHAASSRLQSHFSHSTSSGPLGTDFSKNGTEESILKNANGSSSVGGGFSPVYISKHNTVDGKIDYTAVDFSSRKSPSHCKRQTYADKNDAPNVAPDRVHHATGKTCGSGRAASGQSSRSQNLQPLSEFVTRERGADSEDDSFKRKPLSPSISSAHLPSDSLAPSDSVSQVGARQLDAPKDVDTNLIAQDFNGAQQPTNDSAMQSPKSTNEVISIPLVDGAEDEMKSSVIMNRSRQGPSRQEENTSASLSKSGSKEREGIKLTQSVPDRSALFASKDSTSNTRTTAFKPPPHHGGEQTLEDSVRPVLSSHNLEGANKHSERPGSRHFSQSSSDLDLSDRSSTAVTEQRHMRPVIGRKRKDARYDSTKTATDPSVIAKREILRPRNPTPGHAQREQAFSDGMQSCTSTLLGKFDHDNANSRRFKSLQQFGGTAKARALASEVASLRLEAHGNTISGTRKNSVSTQDYVDEAMKIMDLIRSRKQSESAMWDAREDSDDDMAKGSGDEAGSPLDRPSSIVNSKGPRKAWRDRDDRSFDPRVLSHLKKYEETGEESFLVSSIARSVKASAGLHDQAGSRDRERMDNRKPNLTRRHSDSELRETEADQGQGSTRTNTTGASTGSTTRTLKTDSQRGRNVAVISPNRVTHLLGVEQAGMRFDEERRTWVRSKSRNSPFRRSQEPVSSSTGSEDPLGQIPDLSINEATRDPSHHSTSSSAHANLDTDMEEIGQLSMATANDHSLIEVSETEAAEHPAGDTSRLQSNSQNSTPRDKHAPQTHESAIGGDSEANATVQGVGHEPRPAVAKDAGCRPIPRTTQGTVRSKRREQTVLFSSPPVSKTWPFRREKDDDNEPTSETVRKEDSLSFLDEERDHERSVTPSRSAHAQQWNPLTPLSDNFDRSMSLSRIDEHHEISFTRTRPDGRTMSLSLSISTPFPVKRSTRSSFWLNGAQRTSNFLRSLSPMSEFSVNQNDAEHLHSHNLEQPATLRVLSGRQGVAAEPALTTNDLVRKLTDARPNEPCWDRMRALQLKDQGLGTVYMLDEFCPKLQDLDASHNDLRHLEGVPHSVLGLDVKYNSLSSFTDWSRLVNLQYVDVSFNDLDDLESLNGLVHLRELKADQNRISNLEGILNLEGLLALSVRNNALEHVELGYSSLKRLNRLDLSGNDLQAVGGLSALPALAHLDLSANKIQSFPSDNGDDDDFNIPHHELRTLKLNQNFLHSLDISPFPALQTLHADTNNLRTVHMPADHNLKTLHLRNQTTPNNSAIDITSFARLTNLHLSSSPLPPSLLPQHQAPLFLNLQTLDLSFTGIHSLPPSLGRTMPNLRRLNLNANRIKDLRPLRGILALSELHVVANRATRLRGLVRVLASFAKTLTVLDCRENPVCHGFYAGAHTTSEVVRREHPPEGPDEDEDKDDVLGNVQSPTDEARDATHAARLDEETLLRRRVYELLLCSKCAGLERVDGMAFRRGRVLSRDAVWERLVALGVVVGGGEGKEKGETVDGVT